MLNHLTDPDARPARVLLIGKSGFLARHLIAELQRSGIPCLAVGRPEVDLADPTSVGALTARLQPTDTAVVLAALTPDKGRDVRTLTTNLRMAEHLCAAFEQQPCAHVIYISSDAVYDGRSIPIDEGSSREPLDLYALMHTAREMMLQSVLAARTMPCGVLRPVALFGAGDTHNSYGPNRFVREAFEHRTITLFGEGEDERSHLSVADAARLIVHCVRRTSTGVLNLAHPEAVAFRQVAETIRAACPFPVQLTLKPRPGAGAVSRRPFAVDRVREAFPEFAFTPTTTALQALVAEMAGRPAAT